MPWLELCRGLVRDIRDELERMPTREEREEAYQIAYERGKSVSQTIAPAR